MSDVARAPLEPKARRRVLRTLLVLLALLVCAELALRVTGRGDPQQRFALRAGLNDFARYLAPDELVPGGWRTQVFGDAAHEVRIPARDGRIRVLLVGDANTSSTPVEKLAAALDAAQPGRGHEIVNLGRPGYGSERVLILLRQALPALRPDVVVVRSGHSEFLEPGLGAELVAGEGPGLLERSRLWNVLAAALEGDPTRVASAAGPEPEGRRSWPEPSPMTSHEAAGRVYDAYRFNVESIVREVQVSGARLVLCTEASNMLYTPALSAHREPLPPERQGEFDRARETLQAALPLRLVAGLVRAGGKPPLAPTWALWGEGRSKQVPVILPLPSAGREPSALRPLGAPFEGSLFPPPEFWEPRLHDFVDTLHAFHERNLSDEERASVGLAAAAAERAVALSPGHAHAAFELGLCLYLLGQDERAVALLRLAQSLDVRPNRGNDQTNAIVREVAAAQHVPLLDIDALVADACPGGLVGFEVIMDASTLQPGAREPVALALVPAIVGD